MSESRSHKVRPGWPPPRASRTQQPRSSRWAPGLRAGPAESAVKVQLQGRGPALDRRTPAEPPNAYRSERSGPAFQVKRVSEVLAITAIFAIFANSAIFAIFAIFANSATTHSGIEPPHDQDACLDQDADPLPQYGNLRRKRSFGVRHRGLPRSRRPRNGSPGRSTNALANPWLWLDPD